MNKSEKEETVKLQKSLKTYQVLVWILGGCGVLLSLFAINDYFNGREMEITTIGMAVCSFGGLASVIPQYEAIKKALKNRGL
ncbi:MAG: hypothetical protein AAF960_02645 [Bacteroidota bacterium]